MTSIRDWSIKYKIILHVAVIGIITALFLTFLYIKTQKNIIHSMSIQGSQLASSLIKIGLRSAMEEGEPEKVQSIIQEISHSDSIKKIRILSPQGKILRSSDIKEIGALIGEESFNSLKNLLSGQEDSAVFFLRKKSTMQNLSLIRNSEECFECHSPSQKINGLLDVSVDYTYSSSLLKRSQIQGVFIGVLSLIILSLIILRLFQKLINTPLSLLKEKMKKIQEGNFDISIPPMKNDEIGNLASSFNIMVKKLKEANQKIEELHHQQMEKAEHLASLGELAAGLAHEIKNPVAGLKGALEIMIQKTDPSDPKKEIFSEMLLQVERIHRITQDLLSYAKPKEMSFRLVNPNECVENAIKLARPQTDSKEIKVIFQPVSAKTLARMDTDKIQEVMLNLLLNSVSAIKKKGVIEIKLEKNRKKELKITFSDNGSGIKKEHLPLIFNPFFTTKSRGTGLGLSICKKIIEAHGGSILVRSKEGKGTTFHIGLPVIENGEDQ
ncbi:MAG: PAS domain-containing sensor histidine kinase [Candidatus Aminicenantales bacterium]